MGHFQNKHVIITLGLLLISSLTQKTSMAEGRSVPRSLFYKESEEKMRERALIGSRPPKCERRCSNCGHCEAIQVPIAPQQRNKQQLKFTTKTQPSDATLDARGDDLSNYKPMSWKCKCGSFIFDP